jgi:hypothetical protein
MLGKEELHSNTLLPMGDAMSSNYNQEKPANQQEVGIIALL